MYFRVKIVAIIPLIILLLILSFPATAALEVGGEASIILGGTFYGGEVGTDILKLDTDLELFFPRFRNNEIKFETNINQDLIAGEVDYLIKKLYWKHRYDNFHITVGRQPVSWSFGSLLNPVDYNPGAVVMERETGGKYLDAVTGYLPLDWNSGVTVVAGLPTGSDDVKWGFRGRRGIGGYDVSLNLIREPEKEVKGMTTPVTNRAGLSLKGDLGPAGVYGAAAFSKNSQDSTSTYLVGTDYSLSFDYGTYILMLQLEYLSTEVEALNTFAGGIIPRLPAPEERLNLVLGNINFKLDDFSSISFMLASSLADDSYVLFPSYQNQINNNLELILRGSVNEGDKNTLFKPGEEKAVAVEMILSYSF